MARYLWRALSCLVLNACEWLLAVYAMDGRDAVSAVAGPSDMDDNDRLLLSNHEVRKANGEFAPAAARVLRKNSYTAGHHASSRETTTKQSRSL
jgi:hypothetical protein